MAKRKKPKYNDSALKKKLKAGKKIGFSAKAHLQSVAKKKRKKK